MKKITLKNATTVLILPDMHLPWANWDAIYMAYEWAWKHNPDVVIQLGDLWDQKAWSRWPKDPEDPSPEWEFEQALLDCETLQEYFPDMHILTGNHDLRLVKSAVEASLPKAMIKDMSEIVNAPGWSWHIDPAIRLIVETPRGPVLFRHGDEEGGRPLYKATTLGMNVIQGHTHQTSIQYAQVMDKFFFGAEMGHMMDVTSKAAAYSARSAKGTACGFGVLKHGVPYWIPADGGTV